MNIIKEEAMKDYLIAGELSLDGRIKGIRGVLPITILAERVGMKHIIVPQENGQEAAIVQRHQTSLEQPTFLILFIISRGTEN